MKRKAIHQLLQADDPTDGLAQLMPDHGDKEMHAARKVLAAALMQSRRQNVMDPEALYTRVCSDSVVVLRHFLRGTPAGRLSSEVVARSQAILSNVLTSRAGRPRVSPLTRQEQLAEAQRHRRDKLRHEEGLKLLNAYISESAMAYLSAVQAAHGCDSRAEALELVLQTARKARVVELPVTRTKRRNKAMST